jgi:hypothetical protein
VVAFRLPHIHALRFFPEWAPKALHAITLSWYAEQAVRAYQSNRPPVARSPDDEKVLRVGLYLMSRVSDSKGQFDQRLHAIDPRTTCLARMPTMCVLSIHLATSIISQILVNYSPQRLFPNPIMGVQCSFQFDILRRAVRVKYLIRALLWPSTLVPTCRHVPWRTRFTLQQQDKSLARGMWQ